MPVVKFYSWKLELQLIRGDKEVPDSDVVVVIQCSNCKTMASLGKLSIERCIPGMPVYSTDTKSCSNCIDHGMINYLTGQ